MKIYKEKSYLIFDFENGKNVKYDFATNTAYGINGNPVKDIKTQLKGLRIEDIIRDCVDQNYARFLNFVRGQDSRHENIGSILECIPRYADFEQIFSTGIERIETGFSWRGNKSFRNFSWKNFPKGLIKIAKKYDITICPEIVEFYRKHPDAMNVMFNTEYITLTPYDVERMILVDVYCTGNKIRDVYSQLVGASGEWYGGSSLFAMDVFLTAYGFNAKALMKYLDNLATYEAICVAGRNFMREFMDYTRMMSEISDKWERFPRHFLTAHAIASRNYTRMKQYIDEEKFSKCYTPEMEMTFGDYIFIYPKTSDEIKREAAAQSNCVASYIDRVINRNCDILFLRKKDRPNESLVTIEVRDGKIVQARRRYNNDTTKEQDGIIEQWNKAYKKIYEEKTKTIAA